MFAKIPLQGGWSHPPGGGLDRVQDVHPHVNQVLYEGEDAAAGVAKLHKNIKSPKQLWRQLQADLHQAIFDFAYQLGGVQPRRSDTGY